MMIMRMMMRRRIVVMSEDADKAQKLFALLERLHLLLLHHLLRPSEFL